VICVVSTFPPPVGGISVQTQRLCDRLTNEGVRVLTLRTNPALPRSLRWVAHAPVLRTLVRAGQYLISMLRVVPRASVVHHLAQSGANFWIHSVPLILFCRWWQIRVLINYRSGNAPAFLRRWGRIAIPLLRLAPRIAVPSAFLQRVFSEHGVEASILPNIANTESFLFVSRTKFRPRLLVTRNLKAIYDLPCILRAFSLVQKRFPDAVLGIAGTGPEEQKLKRLCREMDLRGVTFYGCVPNERVPALYAQHDVALNASTVDNFPGALVEAALSGLAIVTSRAGGIPEMIRQRETGLLVDVGDHHGIADAVFEILERPSDAAQRAVRAREWAEQFSWSHVYPKLLAAYGWQHREPAPEEHPGLAAQPCRATRVVMRALLGFVLLGVATMAHSSDFYVSPTGNDNNDGSASRPFRTISRAAALALPGTTVHVAPGFYHGAIATTASGTADRRIRYVSDAKWGAKIRAEGVPTAWLQRGDYVDIEGFEISGADYHGIYNRASHVRILHNHVRDVRAPGCPDSGGAGILLGDYEASDNEVSGNVVHDIGVPGTCNKIHGIYLTNRRNFVQNNIVFRSSGFGINTGHAAAELVIANNLIFGNGGIKVGGGVRIASTGFNVNDGTLVINNIIRDNGGFAIRESGNIGNRNLYRNNLFYNNSRGVRVEDATREIGTISGDPQFIDWRPDGNGDYRLQPTSPAIDAGSSQGAPSIDMVGNKRPHGKAFDIGPYEAVSVKTAATAGNRKSGQE
jgi:glycosyltransferase involved in cell wall biosynthesis